MALSFKDSKKSVVNSVSVTSEMAAPAAELATYNPENDYTICNDGRYIVYAQYFDNDLSIIDDNKNIALQPSQINISQEENSQYIPFKLKRYWDGIDLMDMYIQIHYVNKGKEEDYSTPINVRYNNEYIIFGWLISGNVTAVEGDVEFEIIARGSNEHSDTYTWKTRPNGKLNILKSLAGNGIIEPSTDWYTSFVKSMQLMINDAKSYAEQARISAETIDADTIESTVETSITQKITGNIDNRFLNYYNKSDIDATVKKLQSSITEINSLNNLSVDYDNVTGKLVLKDTAHENTELASVTINSLSNLVVEYTVVNGKGTLSFKNGNTEITSVEIGNVEPSAEWTAAFKETIKDDITVASATIQQSVNEIKADVKALNIDTVKTDLLTAKTDIETLKSDVIAVASTATEAKNRVEVIKKEVDSNTTNLETVNTDLSALESKIQNMESQPSNKYVVNYADNIFTLYENEEVKRQFTITGGGGSIDTSTITIERITSDNLIILSDGTATIEYRFTSVDSAGDTTGNGTAVWKVGNTTVATVPAVQGKNTFDITQYLKTGQNTVRLMITDSFGTISSKNWSITVIEFKMESIFDDSLFYSGDVTFRYTPYGDISKQIVFNLDGQEIGGITTPVTGRQLTQTIPGQSHGAHLLEVYMTAEINGQKVQSNSIYKDIIWIEADNATPVIGCAVRSFSAKQYNTTVIPYVIYDPQHNPASITLSVNSNAVSELNVERTQQVWSYKSSETGTQTLTITCGNVSKSIRADIEELGIDISPVTTNLAFDFNPSGRSNGASDWLKINDELTIAVSDNFDTSNGGYQIDTDGDTYFCVKAGTTAAIPYNLFADDAKKTGKNYKLIYKCTNVKDYDASVLSCYNNNIGLRVNAQEAVLTSEQNRVNVSYCEDNFMELEFNILPDAEYTEMVMWLDSIPTRVKVYSASDSFTQTNPVGITIGSPDCDVWIYRMK